MIGICQHLHIHAKQNIVNRQYAELLMLQQMAHKGVTVL
jgi:hypothetical protein